MTDTFQCISCNQPIPQTATSCKCGHVNEAMRTIRGKRFSGYREELYTRLVIQESRDEYERMQINNKQQLKPRPTKDEDSTVEIKRTEPPALVSNGATHELTGAKSGLNNEESKADRSEVTKVLEEMVIKDDTMDGKPDANIDNHRTQIIEHSSTSESKRAVRKTRLAVINVGDGYDDDECDDNDDKDDDDDYEYHPNRGRAARKARLKAFHQHRNPRHFVKRNQRPFKELPSSNENVFRRTINPGATRGFNPGATRGFNPGATRGFKKSAQMRRNIIDRSGTPANENWNSGEGSDSSLLAPLPKPVPMEGPLAEINKRMRNQSVFWMCLTEGFSFGKTEL